MPAEFVIFGQTVRREKKARSRELRRGATPAERLLWQRLRAHRLAGLQFRRQQVIDGFIVDFYCHAVGLVVEVDGPIHADQPEADAHREEVLRVRGLRVLRLSNDAVIANPAAAVQRIEAAIRSQLPRTSPSVTPLPVGKRVDATISTGTEEAPLPAGERPGEGFPAVSVRPHDARGA